MKVKGRYKCYRNSRAFFISGSKKTADIDVDCFFNEAPTPEMTILYVDEENLRFLYEIMCICKEQGTVFFTLCDDRITDASFETIQNWAMSIFPATGFRVSLSCALKYPVCEEAMIAWMEQDGPLSYMQLLSACYEIVMLQKLLPDVKPVLKELRSLNYDNSIQKIVWIDNWIQCNIQYATGKESFAQDGVYICEEIKQKTVFDLLKNGYGACEDISTVVAIILKMEGIICEVVSNESHSWNLVEIEEKAYILDCTHNITRNPNRKSEALKATRYSNEFTLIGVEKYPQEYSTFDEFNINFSKQDYPRRRIAKTVKELEEKGVRFNYSNHENYKSRKEPIECNVVKTG